MPILNNFENCQLHDSVKKRNVIVIHWSKLDQ